MKSFGRDFVRNVGDWRGMAHGCACKGMVITAVKSVACAWDGL